MNTSDIESIIKYCAEMKPIINNIDQVLKTRRYEIGYEKNKLALDIFERSFEDNMKEYGSFAEFAKKLSYLIPDDEYDRPVLKHVNSQVISYIPTKIFQEQYFDKKLKLYMTCKFSWI